MLAMLALQTHQANCFTIEMLLLTSKFANTTFEETAKNVTRELTVRLVVQSDIRHFCSSSVFNEILTALTPKYST
jgi:hypothetical protein